MKPERHGSRQWRCGLGMRRTAVRLAAVRLAAVRLAAVLSILAWLASSAWALKPESPEVKASVAKAVEFLATNRDNFGAGGRAGAQALVGLVMVKAELKTHPRVQEGIDAVKNRVLKNPDEDIYTLGLSLIFLSELPPELQRQHYPEMEALLERLKQVQKPVGGWGYPYFKTGDTSMTQYGALGLWSAASVGLETPPEVWEKLTNWLIRTQAADGAFGYQGQDPGGYDPIPQERVTLSMSSAGAASLYVCADHYGLLDVGQQEDDGENPKLKRIKTKQTGPATGTVDPARLKAAMAKSDRLLAKFVPEPPDPMYAYPYYYIYASERYRSFRDFADGSMQKPGYEPEWYTAGARHLMGKQKNDGSWVGAENSVGVVPDTCFATLFLLRSMLKTIIHKKNLGAGTLVGGRGLPENGDDAVLALGGFKAKKITGPAGKLLKIVGDPNDPEYEKALRSMEEDGLEPGDETESEVAKQLQKLAKGKSPEQRAAALQALARTRDLDQAPLLIEALKDPDPLVFHAANEGLRFMSRKFYGVGFWGGTDEKTRQDAIEQWKKWYRAVRPGAVLE